MLRRTPVKELIEEDSVPGSPRRKSTRIASKKGEENEVSTPVSKAVKSKRALQDTSEMQKDDESSLSSTTSSASTKRITRGSSKSPTFTDTSGSARRTRRASSVTSNPDETSAVASPAPRRRRSSRSASTSPTADLNESSVLGTPRKTRPIATTKGNKRENLNEPTQESVDTSIATDDLPLKKKQKSFNLQTIEEKSFIEDPVDDIHVNEPVKQSLTKFSLSVLKNDDNKEPLKEMPSTETSPVQTNDENNMADVKNVNSDIDIKTFSETNEVMDTDSVLSSTVEYEACCLESVISDSYNSEKVTKFNQSQISEGAATVEVAEEQIKSSCLKFNISETAAIAVLQTSITTDTVVSDKKNSAVPEVGSVSNETFNKNNSENKSVEEIDVVSVINEEGNYVSAETIEVTEKQNKSVDLKSTISEIAADIPQASSALDIGFNNKTNSAVSNETFKKIDSENKSVEQIDGISVTQEDGNYVHAQTVEVSEKQNSSSDLKFASETVAVAVPQAISASDIIFDNKTSSAVLEVELVSNEAFKENDINNKSVEQGSDVLVTDEDGINVQIVHTQNISNCDTPEKHKTIKEACPDENESIHSAEITLAIGEKETILPIHNTKSNTSAELNHETSAKATDIEVTADENETIMFVRISNFQTDVQITDVDNNVQTTSNEQEEMVHDEKEGVVALVESEPHKEVDIQNATIGDKKKYVGLGPDMSISNKDRSDMEAEDLKVRTVTRKVIELADQHDIANSERNVSKDRRTRKQSGRKSLSDAEEYTKNRDTRDVRNIEGSDYVFTYNINEDVNKQDLQHSEEHQNYNAHSKSPEQHCCEHMQVECASDIVETKIHFIPKGSYFIFKHLPVRNSRSADEVNEQNNLQNANSVDQEQDNSETIPEMYLEHERNNSKVSDDDHNSCSDESTDANELNSEHCEKNHSDSFVIARDLCNDVTLSKNFVATKSKECIKASTPTQTLPSLLSEETYNALTISADDSDKSDDPDFFLQDSDNDKSFKGLSAKVEHLLANRIDNESSGEESLTHFLDEFAEECEEDTPSEGSNDIPEAGESVGSSTSNVESDESYESDFIDDTEPKELLSGNEYDLDEEQSIENLPKKRLRIIQSDSENEEDVGVLVDRIETQDEELEKMSTRPYCGLSPPSVISIRESPSNDENEDDRGVTGIVVNKKDNLQSLEEIKKISPLKHSPVVKSSRSPGPIADACTPNNSLTENFSNPLKFSSIKVIDYITLQGREQNWIGSHLNSLLTTFYSSVERGGLNIDGVYSLSFTIDRVKGPVKKNEQTVVLITEKVSTAETTSNVEEAIEPTVTSNVQTVNIEAPPPVPCVAKNYCEKRKLSSPQAVSNEVLSLDVEKPKQSKKKSNLLQTNSERIELIVPSPQKQKKSKKRKFKEMVEKTEIDLAMLQSDDKNIEEECLTEMSRKRKMSSVEHAERKTAKSKKQKLHDLPSVYENLTPIELSIMPSKIPVPQQEKKRRKKKKSDRALRDEPELPKPEPSELHVDVINVTDEQSSKKSKKKQKIKDTRFGEVPDESKGLKTKPKKKYCIDDSLADDTDMQLRLDVRKDKKSKHKMSNMKYSDNLVGGAKDLQNKETKHPSEPKQYLSWIVEDVDTDYNSSNLFVSEEKHKHISSNRVSGDKKYKSSAASFHERDFGSISSNAFKTVKQKTDKHTPASFFKPTKEKKKKSSETKPITSGWTAEKSNIDYCPNSLLNVIEDIIHKPKTKAKSESMHDVFKGGKSPRNVPSTSKLKTSTFDEEEFSSKDFKNRMLFDPSRVPREDTKTFLKRKEKMMP